jgi:hypothetical protein
LSNSLYYKVFIDKAIAGKGDFMKKFESPTNEIIEVDLEDDEDLRRKIYEPSHNLQVMNILTQMTGFTRQEVQRFAAGSRNKRGMALGSGGTATEASIIERAQNMILDRLLGLTSEYEEEIAYLYNKIIDVKYETSDWVTIIGDDGKQIQYQYNIEDLYGEYEINIETGSSAYKDVTIKRQQDMAYYNFAITSPFANRYNIDLWFARQQPGVSEAEIQRHFNQPPNLPSPSMEFFILLTNGEMPEPDPREKFNEHIAIHIQQLDSVPALIVGDEVKQELAEAVERHIGQTQNLAAQVEQTNKRQINAAQPERVPRQAPLEGDIAGQALSQERRGL